MIGSAWTGCAPASPTPSAADPEAEQWYLWTDDGVRHYVIELGSGAPVVVLHGGWGAEHSYLFDALAPLADRFRFVLYDQRGSLRSPAPPETIRLDRLVADLEELREELELERLNLLTHSMGAQLAYAFARRHPDRVESLVMLGPTVPEDAPVDSVAKTEAWQRFIEFAQANERRQVEAEGLDREDLSDRERSARSRISLASGNVLRIEDWRRVRGGQAFFNGEVYPLLLEHTPSEEWQSLFEGLASVPRAHVIIGDHDLVDFGVVTWPALADSLPAVELTVIEDAAHYAWLDRPERFTDVLGSALAAGRVDVP